MLLFLELKEKLVLVKGNLMVGQETKGMLLPLLVLLLLWVIMGYDAKEEISACVGALAGLGGRIGADVGSGGQIGARNTLLHLCEKVML